MSEPQLRRSGFLPTFQRALKFARGIFFCVELVQKFAARRGAAGGMAYTLDGDSLRFRTGGGTQMCALDVPAPQVLVLQGTSTSAPAVLAGLGVPSGATDALVCGPSAWKAPVRAVTTTTALAATSSAGVLTSTAAEVLPVAGVSVGDRVLVAGQPAQADNGIYVVTSLGAVGTSQYALTRAHDFQAGCRVAGSATVHRAGGGGTSGVYINTSNEEPDWATAAIAFEQVGGGGSSGGAAEVGANSVGLAEMEHGGAGGELLAYAAPHADASLSKAPKRLALGAQGRPLVASAAGEPEYATLAATGLADGSVLDSSIAAAAVTAAELADGAVGSDAVGAGAVQAAKLADGAVTAGVLAEGAVTTNVLGNDAVTTGGLADGAVTAGDVDNGAVTTLVDGSVSTAALANGAVGSAQLALASGSVTTALIADGGVATASIQDLSVTDALLADGSVTQGLLADGSVTRTLLADSSVTGSALNAELYKAAAIVGNAANQQLIGFEAANTIRLRVGGNVRCSATLGGGAWQATWDLSSDRKWKRLEGPVSADPLRDLDLVDGLAWTWKPGTGAGAAGGAGAGVVAQDFARVCPRAVTHDAVLDGFVVDYGAVVGFGVCCAKALKRNVLALQAAVGAADQRANAEAADWQDALREEASLQDDLAALQARVVAATAAAAGGGSGAGGAGGAGAGVGVGDGAGRFTPQ